MQLFPGQCVITPCTCQRSHRLHVGTIRFTCGDSLSSLLICSNLFKGCLWYLWCRLDNNTRWECIISSVKKKKKKNNTNWPTWVFSSAESCTVLRSSSTHFHDIHFCEFTTDFSIVGVFSSFQRVLYFFFCYIFEQGRTIFGTGDVKATRISHLLTLFPH